ncbi:MAG: hypothetical protein JW944_01900 [Deltaproteobacteria bacterium]|nr:hypothetical protein [Deltaproteobacteria bacterium]
MAVSSLLPLALLHLFADSNSAMAEPRQGQPQMGQPQRGSSSSQGLGSYSLPAGTIKEEDIPSIKDVLKQALDKMTESMSTSGKMADYQTIRSGIIAFQDWLKKQGCISDASTCADQ